MALVTPAQAGVQGRRTESVALGSGLRRNDNTTVAANRMKPGRTLRGPAT